MSKNNLFTQLLLYYLYMQVNDTTFKNNSNKFII